MKKEDKIFLLIDSIVNIVLGLLLLCYPFGVGKILGLPVSEENFYALILGAVILGIGIALFIDFRYYEKGMRGLGLEGAIAINLLASIVLIIILLPGKLRVSHTGSVILWIIAILVFLIGAAEYFRHSLFKK
jgi:cation transport ATPase